MIYRAKNDQNQFSWMIKEPLFSRSANKCIILNWKVDKSAIHLTFQWYKTLRPYLKEMGGKKGATGKNLLENQKEAQKIQKLRAI